MAFRKVRDYKELEIVSLIDVVFLLIIFGIVMSVYNRAGTRPMPGPKDILTIHIQRESDGQSDESMPRLMVSISNSDQLGTVYMERFPLDESLNGLTQAEFEDLPACVLIRDRIEYYAVTLMREDVSKFSDHIYIKVTPDTRLRIVSFVVNQCTPYKELLPWVRLAAE